MSTTDASGPDAAAKKPLPWWRAGLSLLLLGGLVFVLMGGEGTPPTEEPAPLREEEVRIPLPPTPHKDVLDEARGIYMLESEQASFSLELLAGGRFRFSSRMRDQGQRRATGTWNLVGTRLSMVYRTVDDAPVENAAVVSNVHRGRTIELRETGLSFPVVLTKRAMIRQR